MGDMEVRGTSGRVIERGDSIDRLVPVGDPEVWGLLVAEALHRASGEGAEALLLLDRATVRHIDESSFPPPGIAHTVLFGPGGNDDLPDAASVTVNPKPLGYDHFLVLLSPRAAFAMVGRPDPSMGNAVPYGGWTVVRSEVERVAREIFAQAGVTGEQTLPGPGTLESDVAFATRLMAYHAELLGSSRPGMGVNKDDLFSVLDILKAISAKRRAHDILFVFVEQIAQVIKLDRCSIVRVWGGEQKGHVLASHEDSRVRDLVISLEKYPELRLAMETRERVVIADTAHDPITREFAQELVAARIRSVIVIPIVLFDANVGSLFLRGARRRAGFTSREVSFCEIVAEAAANALERAHLFEQIQRTNERLEFLAVTDGLTGLYNHRYFRKRLQEEFDRAVRYGLPLSCLIFDVDNFKRINDTHGHLQGDSILREMALRIVRVVRKSDIVARYGGEEFTVILPQTGIDGARVEAERLHRELSEKPYSGMPEDQAVTVSIGVTGLDHESMLDSDALLRAADSALYDAKRQGKNRVVVRKREGEPS